MITSAKVGGYVTAGDCLFVSLVSISLTYVFRKRSKGAKQQLKYQ